MTVNYFEKSFLEPRLWVYGKKIKVKDSFYFRFLLKLSLTVIANKDNKMMKFLMGLLFYNCIKQISSEISCV